MPFMTVYLEAMDRLVGFSSNVLINDIAPSGKLVRLLKVTIASSASG
jgi:hypothetical protein